MSRSSRARVNDLLAPRGYILTTSVANAVRRLGNERNRGSSRRDSSQQDGLEDANPASEDSQRTRGRLSQRARYERWRRADLAVLDVVHREPAAQLRRSVIVPTFS